MGKRAKKLESEVERRLEVLRNDREARARYDLDHSGALEDDEWELLRRIVAAEVAHGIMREGGWLGDTPPLEGVIHDRFEVLGLLGTGGQGRTWLANDLDDSSDVDRLVALKELSIGAVSDWKTVELFEREGEALQSLDHPAIPRYVDAFQEALEEDGEDAPPRLFLAQEYVEGVALDEDLKHHQWSEDEAVELLRQVLDVLEYLHGLSPPVIHRDIKPSNLMRLKRGGIALIDFGAVSTIASGLTGGSTIIGTNGYMPLEQYMGRALPATDLYALGATLVHLLSRRHPADLPLVHARIEFEDEVNLSPAFVQILRRLLSPSVEDRYASAKEVREDLDAITDSGGEESDEEAIPPDRSLVPGPSEPERALEKTREGTIERVSFRQAVAKRLSNVRWVPRSKWGRRLSLALVAGFAVQTALYLLPFLGPRDAALEAANECPAAVAALGEEIGQDYFGLAGPRGPVSRHWNESQGCGGADVRAVGGRGTFDEEEELGRSGWTIPVSGRLRRGRLLYASNREGTGEPIWAAELHVAGVDYRVVPCDGGLRGEYIECEGLFCRTLGSLPDDYEEHVYWNPCDGEGFAYTGRIDFEACCDGVRIGEMEHSGQNVQIQGVADGPVLLQVFTDSSVTSNGIQQLRATCGDYDNPYLHCEGTECEQIAPALPDNLSMSAYWDPCDGGPFWYTGWIHFEPHYDYIEIGGVRFDGYDTKAEGRAQGPVSIQLNTDASVESQGIRTLTAKCSDP